MTTSRLPTVAWSAALAGLLGACGDGGGGSAGSDAPAVDIAAFAFEPQMLEVAAGTTVTWTNRDDVAHTVRDEGGLEVGESEPLAADGTFELTYDEPGSYPYICGIHQYMTGTVVVGT
ncbi:MAG: cupredoxin domain-containing protein [Acidimicrobiales bacterium]